jgi:hypothetical protein
MQSRGEEPDRRSTLASLVKAAPEAGLIRRAGFAMTQRRADLFGSCPIGHACVTAADDADGADANAASFRVTVDGPWQARSPRALAGRLRRAQASLRALGIEIRAHHREERLTDR